MTILCGTDFSELAAGASWVAAQIAGRSAQALHLVHVLDFHAGELTDAAKRAQLLEAQLRLKREADALGLEVSGVQVEAQVLFGKPAKALVDHAHELQADLLVVGAHGRAKAERWHLGSQTEAVAAKARVPFLVLHDDEPFRAWFAGTRALRVLLGADNSATTDMAVKFVALLGTVGRCEVSAVHLFWAPEEHRRLGFGGARDLLNVDPAVVHAIKEGLTRHLGDIPLEIEPHLGNIGDRLAILATQSRADVIVLGAHGLSGPGRLLHGSVSRDALSAAKVSVACVPLPAAQLHATSPAFQSALVATDFSELSEAALALACAAVPTGGTIHVVHVVAPHAQSALQEHDVFAATQGASPDVERARTQLRAWIELHAAPPTYSLLPYVLESRRPAEAIAQAAERLNADLICLGTRGHGALSRTVLGSVTSGLLKETRRPVLIAQAPQR
jgi:nucleotide-binding universal stress UspA family protein